MFEATGGGFGEETRRAVSHSGVIEEKPLWRVSSLLMRHLNRYTNHVADARLRANCSTAPAPRGHRRNSDPLRSQPHQRDSGIQMLNLLQMLAVGFH